MISGKLASHCLKPYAYIIKSARRNTSNRFRRLKHLWFKRSKKWVETLKKSVFFRKIIKNVKDVFLHLWGSASIALWNEENRLQHHAEPERMISLFCLKIILISYLVCCILTFITLLINFYFVNLMRSCHQELMHTRKCYDDYYDVRVV